MWPESKKGFNHGLLPGAVGEGPPVSDQEGQPHNNQPAARDNAVWDDEYNYEAHLANSIPMDGLDATVWCLFHGKTQETK